MADFRPDIDPIHVRPSMGTYNSPKTFRFWCQKVLPLVYDDSLSYYELLCKVVDYLNKTMEDVNTAVEDVTNLNNAFGSLENHVNASETALLQAYTDLQNYVNNYFDSLDFQQAVSDKLDEMASDGTLDALLLPHFNTYVETTDAHIQEITDNMEEFVLNYVAEARGQIRDATDDMQDTLNTAIASQNTRIGVVESEFDQLIALQTAGTMQGAKITTFVANNAVEYTLTTGSQSFSFVDYAGHITTTPAMSTLDGLVDPILVTFGAYVLDNNTDSPTGEPLYVDLTNEVRFYPTGGYLGSAADKRALRIDVPVYLNDVVGNLTGKYLLFTFSTLSTVPTDLSEITDARVGADGVTYQTLGNAIRTQVTDLSNDFNSLVKNSLTFAYELVDRVNFGISGVGKWTTSVSQRSYALPLDGVKKIRVTANNTGGIIAFLNTYNPVQGESVDFATGYTARESLSANETKEYTITNGMNYMFTLLADTSGNDKTPTVNLFLPDAERLCDSYTVNYSNIDEDIFIIAAIDSGAWRDQVNISNPGASRSKTIKINDNTIKIKVTASANNNAIITCLKSYNAIQNETPDYATGWGRRTVTAGESVEFIPPSDAKYFYATTISSANVDMTPTVEITQIKESEKYYLTPIDTETQDETGKHDLGKTIELILREYGICRLSKGIYYVSSIHMPNNSILIGDGNNTVIKLLDSVQSGSAIVMGASCTVKDLAVKGSNSSFYNSDSDGGRYGIEWTGDTKTVGSIDNCAINGFSGAGIYLHDTTQQTYRNLSILGCYVFSNYIGIYIRKNSEFNKIANCTIVANHIGYLNRGGNNDIANCGIDANYQGIQIDSDEGDNNGHGTITGCSVNHSNHNNGYGLIIKNTGRMLVSNCNFYFSKFKLDTTNGNIISNCGFGTSANWEITDGECSMIIGCMVRGWDSNNSPVTITNNTAAKIINCYDRNGNAYEP